MGKIALGGLVVALLIMGLSDHAGGTGLRAPAAQISPEIPLRSTQYHLAADADNNLVADNTVTVTFVYFYYENVVSDWENQIKADMTDIEEVYRQCPELENLGVHFGIDFCDFENFVSRYTDLEWEWRFYGEVEIPEFASENARESFFMAYWYKHDPVAAENVWDTSDVVYGIIEGSVGGGGANNWGCAWLGADDLFGDIWQRRHRRVSLAHELIHDFGAPDHYSPEMEHYSEDNLCIFGGVFDLSGSTILCDFCLERIHWDYLGKVDKQSVFYLPPAPTLTDASVSPSSGGENTSFTYEVTYQDNAGAYPDYVRVYIDNVPHSMASVSGTFYTGAVYQYLTSLGLGSHTYYFQARKGPHTIRCPENGAINGPTVTEAEELSSTEEVPSTWGVAAALLVALVLVTLLIIKHRQKA